MATEAPASSMCSATGRPILFVPPVTSAIRPNSCGFVLPSFNGSTRFTGLGVCRTSSRGRCSDRVVDVRCPGSPTQDASARPRANTTGAQSPPHASTRSSVAHGGSVSLPGVSGRMPSRAIAPRYPSIPRPATDRRREHRVPKLVHPPCDNGQPTGSRRATSMESGRQAPNGSPHPHLASIT